MNTAEEANLQYKVVFTLEVTTRPLKYTVGAYLCTPWPEWCRQQDAGDVHRAMVSLAKSAGADTKELLPDVDGINKILNSMMLRTRFDNKATGPYLLTLDFSMSREDFENYIGHLSSEEIESKFIDNRKARL